MRVLKAAPIIFMAVFLGGWFSSYPGLRTAGGSFGGTAIITPTVHEGRNIFVAGGQSRLPFPHKMRVTWSYFPGACGGSKSEDNIVDAGREDAALWFNKSYEADEITLSAGDSVRVVTTVLTADSLSVLQTAVQTYLVPGPCISSTNAADDVFADGNSVTIAGERFGIKSPVAPLLYDTIDNISAYDSYGLSNGDIIPVRNNDGASGMPAVCPTCPWYLRWYGNAPKYYDVVDSVRVAGRPVYKVSKKGALRGPNPFSVLTENSNVYISWWYRSNHKLYNTPFGVVHTKLLRYTAGMGNDWENQIEVEPGYSYGTVLGCAVAGQSIYQYYAEIGPDQWIRMELQAAGGGNLHNGSGSAKTYRNGQMVAYTNHLYSCTGMLDDIYVWGCDPQSTAYYPSDSKVLFGEFYLDITHARVEIGNNADFNLCTHREIQIPSAWSRTSITFGTNQGTFESLEESYLFVIDSDGNPSAGYPISWE